MPLLNQSLKGARVIRVTYRGPNPYDESIDDKFVLDGADLDNSAEKSRPWPISLMKSCDLSTFLQLNPDYLLLDDTVHPAEGSIDTNGSDDIPCAYLQHQLPEFAIIKFSPDLDILFLNVDIVPSDTQDLRRWYGKQLDNIRQILIQESRLWLDLGFVQEILEPFEHLEVVWVWMESFRFIPGERMRTAQEYTQAAIDLQKRDEPVFKHTSFSVRYIDHNGDTYDTS